MKRIKKNISLILIFILVLVWASPLTLAQEVIEPSPTPTPEETQTEILPSSDPTPSPTPSEVEIEDYAGVDNDIDSTANTGDNEIVASPTPSPSPLPEMCQEEEVTPENGSGTEGETASQSSQEPLQEEKPIMSIETSDSVSITNVENSVNTTEVNSKVLNQTLNIFVDGNGSIDLTTTPLLIAQKVFEEDAKEDEVINVQVLSVDNFAYLSNNIVSVASSGTNLVEGEGDTQIYTGDSYSIVSLLNRVNTTIIDSTLHFVTINIFGNVSGNIILPEFSVGDIRSCCSGSLGIQNQAGVINNVSSEAVSGENQATTSGEAQISTGDANSVVNVFNLVNTNLINVIFQRLYINTMGKWLGDFLGWLDLVSNESDNLALSSTSPANGQECDGCFDEASIQNKALVINNISSSAITGRNKTQGGDSEITTGSAYSVVSLANLVNTSIIGSWGFIGYINIFGTLTGNIGGESEFTPPVIQQESPPQAFQRETGGLLEVSHSHNVGAYVLPGDTVTFFVTVKNPGTGTVYDTKVIIELIKDGVSAGGAFFDIGEIKNHKTVKLTTGLVLSKKALRGIYQVRVTARGLVGPGDTVISVFSDSSFLIGGLMAPIVSGTGSEVEKVSLPSQPQVLQAVAPEGFSKEKIIVLAFSILLPIYTFGRGYQKRREVVAFIYKHRRIVGPAAATVLRSLLLRVGMFL